MTTHDHVATGFGAPIALSGNAASSGTIVLERDIILSSLGLELFVLTLRDTPSRAVQWLTQGQSSIEALPCDPTALRYDWQYVQELRGRFATGQNPVINSSLPASWQQAILMHLGLTPDAAFDGLTAAPQSPTKHGTLYSIAKALRLHQWTKNVLVFVPLLMSHQVFFAEPLINTLLAFICFGLVASSIYLMNDIMDLRQDRRHPSKQRRPFASGALPVSAGLLMIPLLIGSALLISIWLPKMFSLVLAAYVTLNLGYTFYLKRKLLVDVLALSGAYTLRILAGNAAGPIELSNWLLAFSMFLFLSLALVKRYVELDTVETDDPDAKRFMGRGYRRTDLDMLSQLGVASGFAAVIVLALFVEGAGKSGLYKHRELIWLVCPIVLYVIGRIWVLAKRRELPDDPIMFLIRDWRSHLMAAIVAFIFIMAV
ncbi:MAG: UbiA family prenyltransferase [Beijerinckiaceae bacterium]